MAHLRLSIDLAGRYRHLPLFQRIAREVVRLLQRGALEPGARLPSSRALAAQLGVHRNTVLAAYAELEREGYVVTRPAAGTFISEELALGAKRSETVRSLPATAFGLPALPPKQDFPGDSPKTLPLASGMPDVTLMPREHFARAYRSVLRSQPDALDYADERGDAYLRSVLGEMLRQSRGVSAKEDQLMITRGSQMAIYLFAHAIVRPGDVIAVESFGYQPAWHAFRMAGATLVPVTVDDAGVSIEEIDALATKGRLRAVYVTPHHQFPTTVTLSAQRRIALLRLAEKHRFMILEDDYDHDFHFDGRPVLPLASVDERSVVVYIGTLSKVLAPGLRLGYVVAQPELIERMARIRSYIDRQGDTVSERALATLIEDGELAAHIRRARRVYAERRLVVFHALESLLPNTLEFKRPKGGLTVWTRVNEPPTAVSLEAMAIASGVMVLSAKHYCFYGKSHPYLRIGFGRLPTSVLRCGVERLAHAWKSIV